MTRHRFLAALAAASLFFGGFVGAQAQTYPTKPVRLVAAARRVRSATYWPA